MGSKFTDIFIKRPVLATVISLMIFLLGLQGISHLQISEFPAMDNTVITVTTSYPGASAKVIQGFITNPLQQSMAAAEGIDYMTSSSVQSSSTITAYIRLNYDPETALTNIMTQVNQVTALLPTAAQQPIIQKSTGASFALMYVAYTSDNMNNQQIYDYLSRVVQPKLQTIEGVSQAQILGGQPFAMRIWLDPVKIASLGLNVSDVINAINSNNYQTAAGTTKGKYVAYNVNVNTDVQSVTAFENLMISNDNGAIVRLKDVAKVELGAESYDSSVIFDGKNGVFIGIYPSPTANPLAAAKLVRAALPGLEKQYPPGFHSTIVYDGTQYISTSIKEVIRTIIEATLIVIVVIFLFLGSLRTVIIPVVTIPLSLVGACFLMLAMGYSLNLMTLLAMVLAIGLVVDDAIIVVENVYRHMEEGMKAFDAAIKGAREIAVPVISMTITLAAVYAPIGFMGGVTGALFKEFAFTLAMTVILSGIIALTLSPMLASKVMSSNIGENKFVKIIDKIFEGLKNWYHKRLINSLNFRAVTVVFAIIVLSSCVFMAITSQKELAPEEDQGFIFTIANGPSYANIDYTQKYTAELSSLYSTIPVIDHYFVINGASGTNGAFAGAVLVPWNQRKESQKELIQVLQKEQNGISGMQIFSVSPPSIPGTSSGGFGIDFVITTTSSYAELYSVSQAMLEAAQKSGLFLFMQNDLSFDNPNLEVNIDRDKAAALGINMDQIGQSLSYFLGGNDTSRFILDGQSYEVIPQVPQAKRFNPSDLKSIYVTDAAGDLISLDNIVTMDLVSAPSALNQFQQLNSATLGGAVMPGHTADEALAYLQNLAATTLPSGFGYDYGGQTRQQVQEGNTMLYTFLFSLIVIYLVLAAQFESFRDPLIILISVPMSICGALIFVNLGLSTLNIYSGIGLITLIGLISKHGILMVDFANNLQRSENLSIHDAIAKAAAIRLRPILMTTVSMVLGVLPLILSQGPGAVSRFDVGLVIFTGMLIGTCFTLFVVPTVYTFLAKDHRGELK